MKPLLKSRPLLGAFVTSAAAWTLGAPAHAQNAPLLAPKPNVLFICADDLNLNLGVYGHSVVKTPHIDRLAARGVRFDNAFCQYPVCNPSRASFLSGLRPETAGVVGNQTVPREAMPNAVFLPGQFKQHGYFVANAGKTFHYVYDDKASWDISESGDGGPLESLSALLKPQNGETPPSIERGVASYGQDIFWGALDTPDERMGDGIIARRIAGWMSEKRDKPWFLAAGFRKPHMPLNVPKKYFDLYNAAEIPLPPEPPEHLAALPVLARKNATSIVPLDQARRREAIRAYYASISFMDAQVGVLLDQMDKSKLWDSTVVVFFSDHGFQLGEHGGLWQKMVMFEESARVPLIIAAPGIQPSVSSGIAELIDLYPTLGELCGLPAPPEMPLEGQSLVPQLRDPAREGKRAAFAVVSRGKNLGRSVEDARWRYTAWPDGTSELYDHQSDPREYRNLAADPALAATLAELKKLLAAQVTLSAKQRERVVALNPRTKPTTAPANLPDGGAGDG